MRQHSVISQLTYSRYTRLFSSLPRLILLCKLHYSYGFRHPAIIFWKKNVPLVVEWFPNMWSPPGRAVKNLLHQAPLGDLVCCCPDVVAPVTSLSVLWLPGAHRLSRHYLHVRKWASVLRLHMPGICSRFLSYSWASRATLHTAYTHWLTTARTQQV